MKIARIILILIALLTANVTHAQLKRTGIPYTRALNFTQNDMDKQTWYATKDKRGVMYFANNTGLVIYDGANWDIAKDSPKLIKCVTVDPSTDSIYVSTSNDFGVLRINSEGSYEFASYRDRLNDKSMNFGDITKIVISETEGIMFQSLKYVVILKNDSISIINGDINDSGIKGIFKCGSRVFIFHNTLGIKEIKNGKMIEVPYTQHNVGNEIKYVDEYGKGLRFIGTREIYTLIDTTWTREESEDFGNIAKFGIYSVAKTHDGNYLFGTQRNGVFATDSRFNIIQHLDIKGTTNNIYEDNDNLIWICSDNDVTVADLYSPFTEFPHSITGIDGSVKAILQKGDDLYLGASAVFHTKISELGQHPFREIRNDKGYFPIWSLDTIHGQVIGGGNKSLFYIDSLNHLTNIDNNRDRNIRNFCIPRQNPNIMVATGGTGLSTYEYDGQNWKYRRGVEGFEGNGFTRHIEQANDGYFWVSDKNMGVYRIKFNATFDTVVEAGTYNYDKGLPSEADNFIFKADKDVAIGAIDGLYSFSPDSMKMMPDARLNSIFGKGKAFELMYNDGMGNFWLKHAVSTKQRRQGSVKKEWYLEQYRLTGDSTAECIRGPFIPYKGHIYSFGYIGDGCYIIGDQYGFIHYDTKIQKEFNAPYKALIRKMENSYNDSLIYGGDGMAPKIVLPFSQHNVRITFAATTYEHPEAIKYKTYLENNDDDWSDFRSENFKEYANLRPGKYTMHVIAINCYENLSEEATLTFTILPPWYLTFWAIALYCILVGLIIWLIIRLYTQKLKRDNERLEKTVQERTAEIRKQSELILEQNDEISKKNKSITDSINYAKHIQTAMLPLNEKISAVLPDHFILFRPKDIVSGDYYWFAETDKYIIITAADCTGHGVPGAFMSMIGSQILTEIVADGITSPDEILTNQNRRIRKALKQDTTENHDGMDMALCTINKKTHEVEFAGAMNPLLVIQNNEIVEYKADKQGIGGMQLRGEDYQYSKQTIIPDGNTWFYMFSDGYKDQFGGPKNSKFLIKRLRQLLLDIHDEAPEKQRQILNDTIQNWIDTGKGEQTDDIILMGFKL